MGLPLPQSLLLLFVAADSLFTLWVRIAEGEDGWIGNDAILLHDGARLICERVAIKRVSGNGCCGRRVRRQ